MSIKKVQEESKERLDKEFELVKVRGSQVPHQAWVTVNGAIWPNPYYRGNAVSHPRANNITHPPSEAKIKLPEANYEFLAQVDAMIAKNSKNLGDCIIWTGELDANGTPYTYYFTDNKLQYKIYPRRFAYNSKLQIPELTTNQRVTSTCGHPQCVNRDHLIKLKR